MWLKFMPIVWQDLPFPGPGAPYDGEEVLPAVPHLLGFAFGGDGRKVDPSHPFSKYLARWDGQRSEWATSETNEATGGVHWLCFDEPTFWAELPDPY
jgi:hypothetical protein